MSDVRSCVRIAIQTLSVHFLKNRVSLQNGSTHEPRKEKIPAHVNKTWGFV